MSHNEAQRGSCEYSKQSIHQRGQHGGHRKGTRCTTILVDVDRCSKYMTYLLPHFRSKSHRQRITGQSSCWSSQDSQQHTPLHCVKGFLFLVTLKRSNNVLLTNLMYEKYRKGSGVWSRKCNLCGMQRKRNYAYPHQHVGVCENRRVPKVLQTMVYSGNLWQETMRNEWRRNSNRNTY